ncbi:movement protein [Sesamum angolense]|uniref:Movement protein n=1 Tax=Sesamum angolense TaxID=2727404 RepID=A0AAE1T5L5_9LAMI|nr:movement protein [Sesamum angolense]
MTVSNKTMERIMRQDSNLSPYDGFRIGGIGKVLNQIGLNQRKHHIIYKVSSGEFAIPMEFTGNVMEMQLIPKEEILEELSRLTEEIAVTMKWIHIGTIEVVIKATFKEGIDSEIHLSIMDRRINNLRDGCLGTMIGNLKEYIEIPRIFKEFAKQPVVGRYEGMLEIAGHEFLVAGVAGRENGCMTLGLSFLKIINHGEEKVLRKKRPLTNNAYKFSQQAWQQDSSIAIAYTRNLRKKSRTSGNPGRAKADFLTRDGGI